MGKIKKIFSNKRIIILIVFILLSLFLISGLVTFKSGLTVDFYPITHLGQDGVAIRGVTQDSAAANADPFPVLPPVANGEPTTREVIESINNVPVKTVQEYHDLVDSFEINDTITLKTNKQRYFITVQPKINTTILDEEETILTNITLTNETTNETYEEEYEITRNKTIEKIVGVEDIGLNVYKRPTTNIKQGLDLEGGTRVLLQPEGELNEAEDLDVIISSIQQRLDIYGVNDVTVRPTKDFFGNLFISVEVAGVNQDEIRSLLTNEGKFEAKIGDKVVFEGGKDRGVINVCRNPTCSRVDPTENCGQQSDGTYFCSFFFSITLTQEAANAQAAITKELSVVPLANGNSYLSENLSLVVDGTVRESLQISSGLQGVATTDIQIRGSGSGTTPKNAHDNTIVEMKEMQAVLITGSLPVKLKEVKTDTISPVLGQGFISNAILAGLMAILAVIVVVMIRYREWKISIPMTITMLSEVIILLGFAAFIGWRIDIIAIAAIIIAVGSGVDDQIVITDETLGKRSKGKEEIVDWKGKLKKAFFIIMASYFTLVVAMVPLMFAGAGLLIGFAITTIAGVTIGVLITRPAFAVILETLLEK